MGLDVLFHEVRAVSVADSASPSNAESGALTTLPVTLVVPVKNEAATLPELFAALGDALVWPAEIIFVDAGSTDGTWELLCGWWTAQKRAGTRFEIIERPGAFPGGGRNAGISKACAEWIAFLDGGIRPEPDWLLHLHACAIAGGRDHAFGLCRFDGAGAIPLAVCALTNGVGEMRTVLPAAIFHRSVFERIGLFPDQLRSAEDLVWLKRFEAAYGHNAKDGVEGSSEERMRGTYGVSKVQGVQNGNRLVCDRALVHYTHYPATLIGILRKWVAFEKSSVAAGVGGKGRQVYVAGALVWGILTLLVPQAAIAAVAIYILVRGILDPIRRSRSLIWWEAEPVALLLAPVCARCIDAGKLVGALAGLAPPSVVRGL